MDTVLPTLSTGSRLLLIGDSDGVPRATIVVRVSDGLIWISGVDEPGRPGEQLDMLYVVPGDAQYQAPARVELVPPETLALRRIGEWRRSQRRTEVRLTTHGVQLEVERPPEGSESASVEKLKMVDVSAGGAAARGVSSLSSGDDVHCGFQLPGRGVFRIGAKVVRVQPKGRGRVLGFEFVGATPEEQAALRRWIYREESRRHRQSKLGSSEDPSE
ncbi:MAG: PilZ domain-containing protein [bacterium]|nr:PilZ domain-containing protein [bacterium]